MWHLVRIFILSYLLFFAGKRISFEGTIFGVYIVIFGGGGGGRYFRDLLFTSVTFYCYVQRFATFEGSLLSELHGKYSGMTTGICR